MSILDGGVSLVYPYPSGQRPPAASVSWGPGLPCGDTFLSSPQSPQQGRWWGVGRESDRSAFSGTLSSNRNWPKEAAAGFLCCVWVTNGPVPLTQGPPFSHSVAWTTQGPLEQGWRRRSWKVGTGAGIRDLPQESHMAYLRHTISGNTGSSLIPRVESEFMVPWVGGASSVSPSLPLGWL